MCCETGPRDFQIVQAAVRCAGCGCNQLDGLFLYGEKAYPYCKRCYQDNPYCHHCQAPTHAVAVTAVGVICGRCCRKVSECFHCGVAGLESYYVFEAVPGVEVCEGCRELSFGTCGQCGEFAALGQAGYCEPCLHTAVTCEHQARELAEETFRFLDREFGLSYEEAFDFLFVDELVRETPLLGLWEDGAEKKMWVVKGLPLSQFQAVVAHEYAHAWHSSRPTSPNRELLEGFACWVERKVLLELYWDHAAKVLEESQEEFYGPGLRKCLAWERHLGEKGLLRAMREWDEFPDFLTSLAA